jgi:hypothetical protein
MSGEILEKELGCYPHESGVTSNITAKALDNTIDVTTADTPSSRQAPVFNGNVELTTTASRAENHGYTPLLGFIRR